MHALIQQYLEEMKGFPSFEEFPVVTVQTRNHLGETPLHYACVQGNLPIVRLLIAAGAALNQRGEHGYTALAEAVQQGQLEVAKELIDAGADPSIRNDESQDVLAIARLRNEPSFAEAIEAMIKGQSGQGRHQKSREGPTS